MEGKFNNWHKCLEVACFVLILTSSIYKGLYCDGDMGVVIILSFVAILLFTIISKKFSQGNKSIFFIFINI